MRPGTRVAWTLADSTTHTGTVVAVGVDNAHSLVAVDVPSDAVPPLALVVHCADKWLRITL